MYHLTNTMRFTRDAGVLQLSKFVAVRCVVACLPGTGPRKELNLAWALTRHMLCRSKSQQVGSSRLSTNTVDGRTLMSPA